jgi:hypothetical protein
VLIFYKELSLEEGFQLAELPKHSRIIAGREVSLASGIELFQHFRASPIKCWKCGCQADRWVAAKGKNDKISKPVLDLFATKHIPASKKNPAYSRIVMMTRDHIIPRSMGGVDAVENLRPGCELCNGQRGSNMSKSDMAFMRAHPELINQERARKYAERLREKSNASKALNP